MERPIKLTYTLLFALLLFTCMKNDDFVKYNPVYLVGDDLVERTDSLDAELTTNMQVVLQYYNEKYILNENGELLITKGLQKDTELIWNYTTKANDPEWLEEHK